VVAEGIESDEQARELERLGCTHAQGFLFSRPLSARAAEELIMANTPLGPKGATGSEASPHTRSGTVVGPKPASQRHVGVQHATARLEAESSPFASA